jgi:hypothetical protein
MESTDWWMMTNLSQWKILKIAYTIEMLGVFSRVYTTSLKADFQSSDEAPRSSLRVHAWALSSNHNAKQLILIRCKHSQRAARSFMQGLEIRL